MCIRDRFYFVFIASDGYRVVFSWNEIYNTETGNNFFIVTEMEGKKLYDVDQRIIFISTADLKTGRRYICLLYTSDAADERSSVDLGGRRIIKKKKNKDNRWRPEVNRKRTNRQNINVELRHHVRMMKTEVSTRTQQNHR